VASVILGGKETFLL